MDLALNFILRNSQENKYLKYLNTKSFSIF